MLVGSLGYAFQVVIGRILDPEEFVTINAIFGIVAISSAGMNAYAMYVSRETTILAATSSGQILKQFYLVSLSKAVCCVLVIFTISYFLINLYDTIFAKAREVAFFWIAAIMVLTSLFTVNVGTLQGLKQFLSLAIIGFSNAGSKFIFAMLFLAWLGFGFHAALLSTVLGIAIGFTYGFVKILKTTSLPITHTISASSSNVKSTRLLPVFVANVALATVTQFDILLAKYLLPTSEAAVLTATAVLAKSVLYLPVGISLVLFPLAVEKQVAGQDSQSLLVKTLALAFFLCISLSITFFILGDIILVAFFGQRFQGAEILIGWYALAFVPVALVLVLENFLLASGRFVFAWVFLALAPIQCLVVIEMAEQVRDFIVIIFTFNLLLLAIGITSAKRALFYKQK